jgi:hypothetical protein
LKVEFDFTSVFPDDSYIIGFVDAINTYTQRPGVSPSIYFRFVDQSDPAMQEQMEDYVSKVVAIDAISDPPTEFWLRDYKVFVTDNEEVEGPAFNETLRLFLDQAPHGKYQSDLSLSPTGDVLASRTGELHMDQVDQLVVSEILVAFGDQRRVSRIHPVNKNRNNWAFFSIDFV